MVAISLGSHAAHHAGAAAEGDDGDTLARAQLEQRRNGLGGVWEDDGVGGVRGVAGSHARQVRVALAGGVADPGEPLGRHRRYLAQALLEAFG